MAHVAEWKKEEVKELSEIINQYDVIGIVDLMNIPAKQLQEMRKSLNEKAVIRMSKKNLIDLALEDCNADKTNVVDLSEHMDGQVAIIATEMNPFKLYKILEKSKTSAPAKAGAIAPDDIVVPEGDTGLTNLAFMGELGQVGIPARPQDGKIFIQKETVVVNAGEEVSKQMAATLARLDINPMEVGMDLKAVYEEGSVYTSDVLAIDEEQTLADVQKAFSGAFNLSVNAAIPTTKTISTILSLAHTRAVSVGVEGAILTSKTSEPILGLVNARMLAIASAIADVEGAIDDELAQKISNAAVAAAPVVEEEVVEEEEEEETKVFFIVEEMPEFPGGEMALRQFIANAIKYPVIAQENGIQGKVYVTFVVDADGGISDAKVARGVDPSLDKEALRVVNMLPKWKPGKQRGKPVRVSYTVPINFVLQ